MKKIIAQIITVMIMTLTVSCSLLDVVGRDSIRAFDELLKIVPAQSYENGWIISAPDGSAEFLWNGMHIAFKIDARPFINAGLDTTKFKYIKVIDGVPFIVLRCCDVMRCGVAADTSSDNILASGPKTTPLEDYANIVNNNRRLIRYHLERDQHAASINLVMCFKFAKDFDIVGGKNTVQKEDMSFIINPEQLIAAGVNPNSVEGWSFGLYDTMSSPKLEYRFRKVFDLK